MKRTPMMTGRNGRTGFRKLCAALLALALLLPLCAGAESGVEYWICPACGQGGNHGNFCPNCGAARPIPDPDFNESLTQIPGETDWVMVDVLRIDGSSYIKDKKDEYLYAPWNASDEDPASCWQFSAKNLQKKPAWLSLIVEGQTVDEIWIRNGFQGYNSKGKYNYPEYSRAKDIRVMFDFSDGRDPVELDFTLSDDHDTQWEKLATGRYEGVYSAWIYVLSVYKGKSKPANACLSEVMVVQEAPADTAKPVTE